MDGLPLLSQLPPENADGSDETTCRKCNKDFNFIFARQKRCHHCGYAYCSSCADFQALMPRGGLEAGYDVQPVCAYCMDMLTVTASGKNKLRSLPLPKLRAYMKAYNIVTGSGVLEKDDLVEAIMRARGPNGCLLPSHEEYYRRNSVPRKVGERQRTRSFFSRPPPRPPAPPPVVSPQQQQYDPSPGPTPPHTRASAPRANQPQSRSTPSSEMPFQSHQHRYNPPPQSSYHNPRVSPPQHQYNASSTTQTSSANSGPSASQTNFHAPSPSSYFGNNQPPRPPQPPPRPRSAAPTVPATPTVPPPVPSLDMLLGTSSDEISHLSISTLKAVLFQNRVNSSTGVLEKEDLVRKVLVLVEDERRNREIAEKEEQEEAERMRWAKREREKQEEQRRMEERERKRLEELLRQERESNSNEDGQARRDVENPPMPASTPTTSSASYAERMQDGLCVVCCDAYANMAIIDCGHLALCKGCSEIVMKTSRECPLCRTRIVTEQRLLRIFKT